MNYYHIFIIFYFYFIRAQSKKCQNQDEVFNYLDQSCSKCDQSCEACYGYSQFDCISCKKGYFQIKDDIQCLSTCKNGMYLDNKSQLCKLYPIGCASLNTNQICIKCQDNFVLNEVTGNCSNLCYNYQNKQQKKDKCKFMCDINEIEDYTINSCKSISDCSKILQYPQEKILKQQDYQDIQMKILSNNQIVLQSNYCKYLVYDENLIFNYSIQLQPDNPKSYNSFSYDIGVCNIENKFIGYNFIKKIKEFNFEWEFFKNESLLDGYGLSLFPQHYLLVVYTFEQFIFYDYNKNKLLFQIQGYNLVNIIILNSKDKLFLISKKQIEVEKEENIGDTLEFNYSDKLLKKEQIKEIQLIEILQIAEPNILNQKERIFIKKNSSYFLIFQFSEDFSKIKKLQKTELDKNQKLFYIHEKTSRIVINSSNNDQILVYQYQQQKNDTNIKRFNYKIDDKMNCTIIENELDDSYLIVISQHNHFKLYSLNDNFDNNKDGQIIKNIDTIQIIQNIKQIFILYSYQGLYFVNRIQVKGNSIDILWFQSLQFWIYCIANFDEVIDFDKNQNFENQNSIYLSKLNEKFYFKVDFTYLLSVQISKIQQQYSIYSDKNILDFDESIYLFKSKNEVYKLINSSINETLAFLEKQSMRLCDYIKSKKMLLFQDFDTKQYIIFSIDFKTIIKEFLNQQYYSNYNDLMLLFSDGQGIVFAFNLTDLKIYELINDTNLKISFCYLGDSNKILTLNENIFLKVNSNQILQQFDIKTATLKDEYIVIMDSQHEILINHKYNQILILESNIHFYDQNLKFIENFPYDQQIEDSYLSGSKIIDSYLFTFDVDKIYRYDFETKEIISLYLGLRSNILSFDEVNKILFTDRFAIQYHDMILFFEFQENKVLKYIKLNQKSLLLIQSKNELSFYLNVENKPIFQIDYQQNIKIIKTIISSAIQIQYYYGKNSKQIIKYNIIKKIKENSFNFTNNFEEIYVDYKTDTFYYTQKKKPNIYLNCFDPNSNGTKCFKETILNQDYSKMIEVCFNEDLFFVQQLNSNKLMVSQYKNLEAYNSFILSKVYDFRVFCDDNLLVISDDLKKPKLYKLDGNLYDFQYVNLLKSQKLYNIIK